MSGKINQCIFYIQVRTQPFPATATLPVGLHVNPVEGVLGGIVLEDTDAARVSAHHYVVLASTFTKNVLLPAGTY